MPNKYSWIQRIKVVEIDFLATRFAVMSVLGQAVSDSSLLEAPLRIRDLRHAANELEGTYLVRMFSEFETVLRAFWITLSPKVPPSRTRDLIDSLGTRCSIPEAHKAHVHSVRMYRNVLVHERDDEVEAFPLSECRSFLLIFVSYLDKKPFHFIASPLSSTLNDPHHAPPLDLRPPAPDRRLRNSEGV